MAYHFPKDNANSQVFFTHFVVVLKSSFSKFDQVNVIGFIVQVWEKHYISQIYIYIYIYTFIYIYINISQVCLGRKNMKESKPLNFKFQINYNLTNLDQFLGGREEWHFIRVLNIKRLKAR